MPCQVLNDLFFGFRNKTEAPAITEYATYGADRKCARVPERAEPAGAGIKFGKALFAPGEMVEFLFSCVLHLGFNFGVARYSSMPLIQALCRNFSGVVNPHEACCVLFLSPA
jgi:hypothetical protein